MKKVVTLTTFLQMTSPQQARLDLAPREGLEIVRAGPDEADIVQQLYVDIGRDHLWTARSDWTREDFARQLAQEKSSFWLAKQDGMPAGFAETYHHEDDSIQIIFFGIQPDHAGQGIGKHLLSCVIEQSWARHPKRICLHTRTYDGEAALPNYLKRGFVVEKVRPQVIGVPSQFETRLPDIIKRAKQRGVYPSFWKRTEARARASPPGRAAGWALYQLRRALRKTLG